MSEYSGRDSPGEDAAMVEVGEGRPPRRAGWDFLMGRGGEDEDVGEVGDEEEEEENTVFHGDTDEDEDSEQSDTPSSFSYSSRMCELSETAEPQGAPQQEINETEPTPLEMTMMVVEYLIIEGYRDAARALCEEANVHLSERDWESVDTRVEIRKDILDGRITEAISKVEKLAPSVLENMEVRFNLYQQKFIELLRVNNIEEALQWAQEKLSNDASLTQEQVTRLQRTCTLAAFEQPEKSKFGDLLAQEHRIVVATSVNRAILRSLQKPDVTRVENLLKVKVFMSMQDPNCVDKGTTGELIQAERIYNSL